MILKKNGRKTKKDKSFGEVNEKIKEIGMKRRREKETESKKKKKVKKRKRKRYKR